jgi:hypothetical protein
MLDSKGGSSPAMGGAAPSTFEKALDEIPTINQEQPMDEEITVEDIPF